MTMTRGRALKAALGLGAVVVIGGPQKLLDALANIEIEQPPAAPKFPWLEDEMMPRYTLATADAGEAITVTKGTGAYFRAGDILRIELTGENMAVTAVSSDTLSVVRGIGSNLQQTASPGDGIIRIGQAWWEPIGDEIAAVRHVA